MGINNFFPFVERRAPGAVQQVSDCAWLRGARLGVDAPVTLYRARAALPHGLDFLVYLAERLEWLRGTGARALFVFDGPAARAEKAEERAQREERRRAQALQLQQWQSRLQSASDWDELLECRGKVEQLSRSSVAVGERERRAFQRLLSALGWIWCSAEGEGEQYLAHLQQCGRVDYVVTEDSDALVCGAPAVVRNFWALRSGEAARIVRLEGILRALGVDERALRTAAVLAGCDFAPKLRNVGLVRALKVAARHPEDFRSCLAKLKQPADPAAFERAAWLLTARAPAREPRLQAPAPALLPLLLADAEEVAWALRGALAARRPRPRDLLA
jgi:5'-3' exonuclease